jgi:hypothetical protein
MQTPNDCALLITIPLTEHDFLSDLQSSDKDFVKNWAEIQRLARDEDLTDTALWEIYSSRVRDYVLGSADEIKSLGVRVVFNTTLEDLAEVFLEKEVITLEAHWFSPKLKVEDFKDPNSFVKSLSESDEMVAKALRKNLFSNKTDLSSFSENIDEDDFDYLVRGINTILSGYHSKGRRPAPVTVASKDKKAEEEIWIQLNRFALEKTFPDEIEKKCRIEMFDGLYSIEDFAREVPAHFDGVIDLTVCNSELAGKDVKQYCSDCLVLTNRYVTDLKLRLILYKGAIKLLFDGICETYVDAVFALRKQLVEMYGRE